MRDQAELERMLGYGVIGSQESRRLKNRGHDLIDMIESLGIERARIYHRLGSRMGSPMRAHFAHVNDTLTLGRMVRHLEEMLALAQRPAGWRGMKGPDIDPDYSQMFTDKAVLRAVGERNRRARLPVWHRWALRLRDIFLGWRIRT